MRGAVGEAVLAVALVACSSVGLDMDRPGAIAKGLEQLGGPADAVVSAVWSPTLPDGSAPPAPDRGVWRIEFRTSFEEPRGPPPAGGDAPAMRCRVERVVMFIGSVTGNVYGGDREGRPMP